MTWFAENKDLISLAVATLAVALSLVTVLAQRRQQRHDAYRHMHELLITPELQHGRRLAYLAGDTGEVPNVDSPEWYLVNRAVGMFDTLATYYRRGLVPKRLVLEVWHHALRDIRRGAEAVRARRRTELHTWAVWPHLWLLIADADGYRSRLDCCQAGQPDRSTMLDVQPQRHGG